MKKAISVMLAAGMAVSLAACGGSSNSSSSASGSAAASGSTSATASAGDNGEVYEMRLANPNPVGDVKDLALGEAIEIKKILKTDMTLENLFEVS